jgi:WD40 repeat protein/serine/threonine protein kinase
MENLTSTHIKGYELRERLGAGGFGAVYKAFQSTVGREVAIKIILAGFANRPEFIRRFETEAQLIARLEHPYITPLYDYWRDPDGAYLVMRWLRGGSLRDALQNGAYDLEATAQLLEQITSALSVAHRNNVIHRDLKPGNILLDEDGNAYLADFGIAKDLGTQIDATAPDAVVGSLDYLSPEQARSEPVTPRTDIYSLGVVLYELLTGKHPYVDCTAVEKLYKHLNEPLPDLTTLDPAVQANLNAVVQKATAKNPAHRYADALEFIAAFRQAAALNQVTGSMVELLTLREQEVLERMIAGLSNKEIAQELFITVPTVKWYVTQIFQKLHVRSRVQAIVRARELHLVTGNGVSTSAESASSISRLPEPENPYKGLRAFQTADARDFFGREALVQKLVGRLTLTTDPSPSGRGEMIAEGAGRFLAVVGPSGSGKSSLVKAGIIPALLRGDIPGSERWFVVEMLPGERPLDELEVALIKIAANQAPNLGDQLRRDRNGLLRAASLILPHDGSELVLVIDQFEEVFTLVEDESARAHFLDVIQAAVTNPRSRVRVVITLRADFYDRPLHYPDFGELVRSHMETILPLTAEGLARAIAKPAEQVGLRFEEGLVTKIVSEVNYQPGALPLLQYALTELFERREGRLLTHEAYLAVGGTVGALAKRAEEIYEGLSDEGREAARQMFLRLITLGEGTEDTRRRVARNELLAIANPHPPAPSPEPLGLRAAGRRGEKLESLQVPLHEGEGFRMRVEDVMDEIIDTYAAYRLLSLDNDPGTRTPTVELAHEAIIREWERLRAWLNDSREDIKLQRQLSHAADEWRAANRDASFLLTGSRLETFEKWLKETQLALTPLERDFLQASLEERTRQVVAEQARQERELRLERRSQTFLRGLVAVFAVATLVSAAFGMLALNREQAAATALENAEQSAAEFRSVALSFGAKDALDSGQPDVALALAREAVNMDNPPLAAEQTFFTAGSATWIKQRLLVSDTRVWDAVYHPDGKRVITTSWDGRVVIWDMATGHELQSIQLDGRLLHITVHPNNQLIAIGGDQGRLHLWDTTSGEVTHLIAGEDVHQAPAFTPDGTQLITGSDGTTIYIWDMATGESIRSFTAHQGLYLGGIHLNDDGHTVSTASTDGAVKLWDLETGELIQTLNHDELGAPAWMWDGLFLPDGVHMLTVGGGGVYLWNWQSGALIWSYDEGAGTQDVALSPDGRTFVVGLDDPNPVARLREVETGNLIHEYRGHGQRIQNVDFSPDGTTILTASNDGTVAIWPVNWEGALQTFFVHSAYAVAWHPTKPLIATAGFLSPTTLRDSTIRLVDTRTGEIVQTFVGHRKDVLSLAFTPDGRFLLSGDSIASPDGYDERVYVWDVETGERVMELGGHGLHVLDIAISPDGHIAAVGDAQASNITLWNLETGERIRVLEDHEDWVQALVFSPDGQTLYSGAFDGTLFQWDVQSGQLVQHFAGHPNAINDLDMNSDGTRLLSVSQDKTAIMWNTQTGEPIMTLVGHSGSVMNGEFSPDDRFIMTGSNDGWVMLWDAQTGQRRRTYVAAENPYQLNAAFSPDGKQIVSAANGIITIWDASPLSVDLETWVTQNRYIPDFTCEQRALYVIEPLCDTDDQLTTAAESGS